ncbi:MAG: hypothetical protein DWI04_06875, partial [Planctomycetota bacterium]
MLALQTAQAVAAVAIPWGETAAAMKLVLEPGSRGGPQAGPTPAAVLAEETATGPLGTVRLLVLTAQTLADVQRGGLPKLSARPRPGHPDRRGDRLHGGLEDYVEVDVLPSGVGRLHDSMVFRDYRATVRCGNLGDMAAFDRAWAREIQTRPTAGGVAVALGAGNVTGLAVADAISHIFEHGRAVLLKLHPLHGALEPILREALRPLMAAGVLEIVTGGAEVAKAAVAAPLVTHVHLTGGDGAYDALVWGGPRRDR